MPIITQTNTIDITVEKFLDACSAIELMEVDMFIQKERFQNQIKNIKSVKIQFFDSLEDLYPKNQNND